MTKNVLDEYAFFLRYALVGFASFCVDSGVYWTLLTIWGNEWYLLFYALSHLIAFAVNVSGHKFITYRGYAVRKTPHQFVLHGLLKLGNFVLSTALLYALVEGLGLPPGIGVIVNLGLVLWSLVAASWIFAALHPKEALRTLGRHVRRIQTYVRSLFRSGPLA